ncbi:GreA/GreB family elongation factor [Chryseolinea sp. T2]|uniref:GreA/GreB family elongation factor n=1 Tax=Chryseolinea sp. T2 TaxID=3129255 RepID=UPI0030769F87
MQGRLITLTDYRRLMDVINTSTSTISPMISARLTYELNGARIFASEDIDEKVITMNSRALLRDRVNGSELEVTVTYPGQVDIRSNRISVFSPAGLALLGRKTGTIIAWNTQAGLRQFEVVEVLFQPEAVGDYSL